MDILPLVDSAVVIAGIIGATQAVKTFLPERFGGLGTILVAALLGALAGADHIGGLSVIGGVFYGLSAIGVHTVATTGTVRQIVPAIVANDGIKA